MQWLQHNNKACKAWEVTVDTHAMFNRMITVAMREENIEELFYYELTQEPMSLFKDGMMRKPDKPSLRKVIMPEEDAVQKEDIKHEL